MDALYFHLDEHTSTPSSDNNPHTHQASYRQTNETRNTVGRGRRYDVNPEKRRTRWSSEKSFGRSLSRSMYFPDPRTICSPGTYGSGSELGNMYGLLLVWKDRGRELIADFAELHEKVH